MKKILLIASAIACALPLAGCQSKAKKAAAADAQEMNKVKVETARVETVAQTVDLTANLEGFRELFISPSIQALRIDEIKVEVGDRVRKGQVLVELDKTQYNTTALQFSNAELNLSRMKPVYESGGVSKQQIDELENNIDVMKETLANLEANMTLRSPIDGVVTGRYNEVGDVYMMSGNADGGIGILQVKQMDRLKAYVYVSEQYFPYVYMGMPVDVHVEIFPDKTYSGKVSRINPSINAATRTFEVEVTIPNSSLELRPGMYARTVFNMGETESVTVQDMAVKRQVGTNDKYVFVVNDDNTVDKRLVTTGRQNGDRMEVLSGLEEGERVVVAGANRLLDGMVVNVVTE